MPRLKAALPDHLSWLTEKVEALVRPAAFLVPETDHSSKAVAALGSTLLCGMPDVPVGAPWEALALSGRWSESPYDGESCYLQLDLESVPADIQAQFPHLPRQGVLWVTIDLSGPWEATVYFDPRPRSAITWHPRRLGRTPVKPMHFVLKDTLTCATDQTLPEIASDYHGGVGMCVDYDDWWQEHYAGRQPSDVQLGGWIHPIQGDTDEDRKTVFLAMERQEFGDHGAIYLHHSPERGFFAHVHTH